MGKNIVLYEFFEKKEPFLKKDQKTPCQGVQKGVRQSSLGQKTKVFFEKGRSVRLSIVKKHTYAIHNGIIMKSRPKKKFVGDMMRSSRDLALSGVVRDVKHYAQTYPLNDDTLKT